jgi:hypothetical protein
MASPLTPPKLDDRTFDELRAELVRRIPAHTPEWTDHNAADPGIAIIEVFAWLAQNLLYRMNRVPDAATRRYLDLLGVALLPASPAEAQVRLTLPRNRLEPARIGDTPSAPLARMKAGDVQFEALGPIDVLPLEAAVYIKDPYEETLDQETLDDVKGLFLDVGVTVTEDQVGSYRTRALPEPEEGRLPPAVALQGTLDRSVWIALLVPEAMARTTTADQIAEAVKDHVLNLGVRVDDTLEDGEITTCPAPGSELAREAEMVWQVATGDLVADEGQAVYERPIWSALTVVEDTTAGLARSGVVRLRLPSSSDSSDGDSAGSPAFGTWSTDALGDPDFEGVGDRLPPRLDDPTISTRVVTWIRGFRKPQAAGAQAGHPVLRWVGVNVVDVHQTALATNEFLGWGTGRPGQVVRLVNAPVLTGTLLLDVGVPGAEASWQSVPDFGASRPNDPHYVLDEATGAITFGDGIRGRIPQPREILRARAYRWGGGAVGNVGAGAISKVVRPTDGLSSNNPLPACHGKDSETLEEARVRLPSTLRHRDRAVATSDFVDVAMQTPGVQVGRVHVLPRHKPQEHLDEVAGVVTLVVLPAYDPLHPDEPVPDRDMLRRVCEHLEPRRLVTTELYLVPPTYVGVWVSAAFEVEQGYSFVTVRGWVELAIRQFFAPLPPYGPTGAGWPFARAVRLNDVAAAVLRVEGVRLLHEVKLHGEERPTGEPTRITTDATGAITRIALDKWELPAVRGVTLALGEEAPDIDPDAVGDPTGPLDGEDGGQGGTTVLIPVPVEEDVC